MPAVSLRTVTKLYSSTQSGIRDVSLDVGAGEHLVIVGPSGAGKTTVLRIIAGLETPDAGWVEFDGRNITVDAPHKRHVALVAQRPAMFPHRTVRRNLSASLEFRQSAAKWKRWLATLSRKQQIANDKAVSKAEIESRVQDAAQVLGLTSLLDRRPYDLSGGEQQRVALGRAWVERAAVWLLDEPLAHLEAALKSQIRMELDLLRGRSGATMIEVTHDPAEALALGPRVAVLADGQVVQVGPPNEVYDRPRSIAVALALGEPAMNVVRGVVASVAGRPVLKTVSDWSIPLPETATGLAADRAVTLGVRPEHIMAGARAEADGLCPLGTWDVARGDPRGFVCLMALNRAGLTWQAWWPQTDLPAETTIELGVRIERIHLFDGRTGERLE